MNNWRNKNIEHFKTWANIAPNQEQSRIFRPVKNFVNHIRLLKVHLNSFPYANVESVYCKLIVQSQWVYRPPANEHNLWFIMRFVLFLFHFNLILLLWILGSVVWWIFDNSLIFIDHTVRLHSLVPRWAAGRRFQWDIERNTQLWWTKRIGRWTRNRLHSTKCK